MFVCLSPFPTPPCYSVMAVLERLSERDSDGEKERGRRGLERERKKEKEKKRGRNLSH